MGAILTAVLPALLQLLQEAPALVREVEQAWALLTSSTAATADQQKAIDDALAAAHTELQGSGDPPNA